MKDKEPDRKFYMFFWKCVTIVWIIEVTQWWCKKTLQWLWFLFFTKLKLETSSQYFLDNNSIRIWVSNLLKWKIWDPLNLKPFLVREQKNDNMTALKTLIDYSFWFMLLHVSLKSFDICISKSFYRKIYERFHGWIQCMVQSIIIMYQNLKMLIIDSWIIIL